MTISMIDVTPETLRAARTLTPEQVDKITAEHDRDDYTAAERWAEKSGH